MSDNKIEYRKDGWPLCPQCGENELYSHVCMDIGFNKPIDYKPTLNECLEYGFTCYNCHWTCADLKSVSTDQILLDKLSESYWKYFKSQSTYGYAGDMAFCIQLGRDLR